MESTAPLTEKEGEWSDADDNVDDGLVEGFDDENWDCDGSKGKANADATSTAVESSNNGQMSTSAFSASAVPASAEAEAASPENFGVDNDDASAADTAKDPETAGKWGIGSTLTAFAGALQQVRILCTCGCAMCRFSVSVKHTDHAGRQGNFGINEECNSARQRRVPGLT